MSKKFPAIVALTAALPALAQVPPRIGNCPVFPADHIWNTPVDNLPVNANSAAWISRVGPGVGAHADFGSGLWQGEPFGFPYITVPGTQTKYPASFTYVTESDPGPYAVPLDAPIQSGPTSTGDRHVLSIDVDNCILYEFYKAYPQTASWNAGSGAIFNLLGYTLRPAGWTSADAAGLPIFPGMVRYEEVANGEIRHALRFTVPQTQKAYIWPARHYASSITDPTYPPMGARFRLRASFDVTPYPPEVQVILRCLKRYGMIVADNGGAWHIGGTQDDRWNNDNLHQIGSVLGSDFEAVDTSSLIIDPNTGQAKQTAVLIRVSPSSVRLTGGAMQQFTATVTNTSNTGVTWSVNGVPGGAAATGRIDATGRYVAPTTPVSVTVEATSLAKSTAREVVPVTVTAPTVTVTVAPAQAAVPRGTSKQFTATVTGTTDQRVRWRVAGVLGGNATVGTITPTGLYTAPAVPPASQPVIVSAGSVAAAGMVAWAKVQVQ